jgi:hypothetical protein
MRARRGDGSLRISCMSCRSLGIPSRAFRVGASRLCLGLRAEQRLLGRVELCLGVAS